MAATKIVCKLLDPFEGSLEVALGITGLLFKGNMQLVLATKSNCPTSSSNQQNQNRCNKGIGSSCWSLTSHGLPNTMLVSTGWYYGLLSRVEVLYLLVHNTVVRLLYDS